MMTSKPPPLGMIKVDFWSSNAKLYASGQMALIFMLYREGLQMSGSWYLPSQQSRFDPVAEQALLQGEKSDLLILSSG